MKTSTKVFTIAVLIAIGAAFFFKNKGSSYQVQIGVILPLTGPGAPYGNQVMDGINLAKNELKKSGKFGESELQLLVEDDKTDPAQGVSAINKLVHANGAKVVIGALASSVTLACAPLAEREKVILLSPGSSSDEISNAGDYIFRIAPRDSYDGEFLAKAMFDKFGIKSAVILHLNNDFGSGLMRSFTAAFAGKGGKILQTESYSMGANDFRPQLQKLKGTPSDAVLLIAAGNENSSALKQIKETGITGQVFAPSTLNDPKLIQEVGDAGSGVIFSASSFDGIKSQESVKDFLGAFAAMYPGKKPTTFTAYGYDSLMILVEAIKQVGNDSDKVKSFLYSMPAFSGASGQTTFDKSGDAQKELTLFKISNGQAQNITD